MLFISFISFTVLYLLWIHNEYQSFKQDSAAIKEKFIAEEKEKLKNEVQAVSGYIQYMRNQTEKRLRDSIQERVNEACAVAMNIYTENRDSKSGDEIKKMIKDALRPVRFNKGRGYYFAFNMDGIEELFADRPELEGKNMMEVMSGTGKYVVRDMIEIVKERGEGFYSYVWSKPGEMGGLRHPKISFVKYFEPYGWGIGTGEYVKDVENEIQEEVLERISTLRFEKDGYFFGSIYGGLPLFTNGKITKGTKSVWDLTDPEGVKIIQEQNRAAKEPGGGFVSYSWPKLNSEKLSSKLSYVVAVPEWEWVIGAGIYFDIVDESILIKEKSLYKALLSQAGLYLAAMTGMSVLIFLWTRYQANKIQSGIRLFSDFFEAASLRATTIDPAGLQFEEFKDIAVSANQMIEKRTEAIQALEKSEKEKKRAEYRSAEQEKHALVGRVAGKMSHDFNNILGVIMGHSELALMDCREAETRKTLELIHSQTLRGRNLTKNLIAFARDQEPRQEYIKINEKIDLVVNLMKKELEDITISRQFEENLPEILADPGMMEHAMVNLIQNSIHALSTRDELMIILRTYTADDQVCIEIEDNGCGIPQEHLGVIFEPSFTLKGGKDTTGSYGKDIKGTGYGLANVKKYIDQHRGSIKVRSEFGSGACFPICLPVIKKNLTEDEKEYIRKSGAQTGKTILIVEDEPAIFDVQNRMLTDDPCRHRVDIAQNGRTAMDLINLNHYDLVSLDYMLPGDITGMDVYRHIRKRDPHLPVLFISGNIEFLESIKDLRKNDPLMDHLSKPCRNQEYIEGINALLEKALNM